MYNVSDTIIHALMTVYESKSIILNLFYNFIFFTMTFFNLKKNIYLLKNN